jgi:hypothetical protein
VADGFTTRPYAPEQEENGWAPLAAVYDAYNASRPLTTVRDLSYWRSYAVLRLRQPHITIFVAAQESHPDQVIGYIIAHIHSETIAITELAVLPEHPAAVAVLIGRVQREAQDRSISLSRVFLPREPIIDSILDQYFQETHNGSYEMLMGRPLAEDYTMAAIETNFKAPGAIAWPTDDF